MTHLLTWAVRSWVTSDFWTEEARKGRESVPMLVHKHVRKQNQKTNHFVLINAEHPFFPMTRLVNVMRKVLEKPYGRMKIKKASVSSLSHGSRPSSAAKIVI